MHQLLKLRTHAHIEQKLIPAVTVITMAPHVSLHAAPLNTRQSEVAPLTSLSNTMQCNQQTLHYYKVSKIYK
jgi:hypothetical protein